ncbi:type VI secretion system-associated FHA domain protein TagH [Niveispirillum sp. KHB5.9]|uniref:type VI secretion system-associated FHA domain protein TagH n=1 Tax=Niveispirillum sp. KHB5.9 TaxID=3400269 RepID=UPI003A8BDA8D
MISLRILRGAGAGKTYETRRDEFLIGRGTECDLRLPDDGAEKTLSRRHCRITRSDGRYLLTDLSANGVYVNEAPSPLGFNRQHTLDEGDRLRLAMYEMEVGFPTTVHTAPPAGNNHFRSPFADADIAPAQIDDDPLNPFASIVDARGRAVLDRPIPQFPGTDPVAAPAPLRWEEEVSMPDTEREEERKPQTATVPPSAPPADAGAAWQAFLTGAALSTDAIDAARAEEVLGMAGAICRVMVEELRRLLDARAALKQEFGLEQTDIHGAGQNNPLKTDGGTALHLQRLLLADQRLLAGDHAVRQAFGDVRWHEYASAIAMRAAMKHLLKRFDPERLEANADTSQSAIPLLRHAALWRQYGGQYRTIIDEFEHDPQSGVSNAYARAYQRALENRPHGE